jgi:hypothetical protein
MTVAKNLFFGTSILKSQYAIIRQQLVENSLTEESYWIIVFIEKGPNLLECISMEAYKRLYNSKETYMLAGVIKEYNEFPTVAKKIIEELLTHQYSISKSNINKLLQGEYND